MSVNINRVILLGNLTRDPELRHTASGTAVCNFSIASNSRDKVDGEWQDRADFFDVTVWAEQAELCSQYLRKGSLAGIEGRLRQERWKDKETQANRSKVIIVASTVQFLDSRGRDGDEAGAAHQSHESSQALPDDDIPF